jgi:hypothetical protein
MPALVADHTTRTVPDLTATELVTPALAIHEFDQWSELSGSAGLAYFSGSCTGPVEFELEAAA